MIFEFQFAIRRFSSGLNNQNVNIKIAYDTRSVQMLQQTNITIDYLRVVCQQLINVQEKHFIAFTWI